MKIEFDMSDVLMVYVVTVTGFTLVIAIIELLK
jgi:hypothetical protein